MLYVKNRLIIGAIIGLIKGVLKFIYKLLSLFNLQITLLIGVVGIILFFSGVFENNSGAELIFFILLIFSILYAVYASVRKILRLDVQKKEKRSRIEIVETKSVEKDSKEQISNINEQYLLNEPKIEVEKPKYYRVKQNPNYVMAEYSDRYELYYKTANGLKKVRTDYKRGY
jgi:hypothetical protein